jgi:hypothetical protein
MSKIEKHFNELMLIALISFVPLAMTSCDNNESCEDCYTYTYSDGSTEWMCVEYDCSDYYYRESNEVAKRLIQSSSYNLDIETPSEVVNSIYTPVKCDIKGTWLNTEYNTYWRFGARNLRIFDNGQQAGVFNWEITESGSIKIKIEGSWYLFEARFISERPEELALSPNRDTKIYLDRIQYPVGESMLAFDFWNNECNEYYN